jgi:hypothetical protein
VGKPNHQHKIKHFQNKESSPLKAQLNKITTILDLPRKARLRRQQERVEEPSQALAEVLAKLKILEKAKGKISAQVAAKQKAAKRKLAHMQAELEDLRRAQEEGYDSAWDNEQGEAVPSSSHCTHSHNRGLAPRKHPPTTTSPTTL